jgi:hypothetical protein
MRFPVADGVSVEPRFGQLRSAHLAPNSHYFLEMTRKTSGFFRKLTRSGQIL